MSFVLLISLGRELQTRCFKCWKLCLAYSCMSEHQTWYEEGSEVPPFKSDPCSNLGPPSNSGLQAPLSAFQYYVWSPETVVMVRWKRGTFGFDYSYKQKDSKMLVTERFEAVSNINLGSWPTWDPLLANLTNWTTKYSLTLKKIVFKIRKYHLRIIFILMAI